eukprot:CAMPEP_0184856872 /NCGR_PEP_ID=MMETSP0580-20130426/2039_1 /TAXON_ID=1118495 /ORGANISM="Dactyliosolen fragilissimus" /LENGTH=462 /DNA_ID=CAMNT_0027352133 /DNA_START=195 /DNA_END=1579 /DNA_ORIENTATION=+
MTDEHNLRTIGAYREILGEKQGYIWGKQGIVSTPNIDRLARSGTTLSNFYVSSPSCTPSRASFMTGLYPWATGATFNHLALNSNATTFANILEDNGYINSYIGKWHLDGDIKPGFKKFTDWRKFGFQERDYMYNRGHWKLFEEVGKSMRVCCSWVQGQDMSNYWQKVKTNSDIYGTDFLVEKAKEVIEKRAEKKNKPFSLFLSIPDPHTPMYSREPYESMYDNLKLVKPKTMKVNSYELSAPDWLKYPPGRYYPRWPTEDYFRQVRKSFGMVKLIDDKIGELLDLINRKGMYNNTIIVFTSDHGNLMGEHASNLKGSPYKTSATVPFIIRYPNVIPPNRVIQAPAHSTDFAPTLLNLVGVKAKMKSFHGENLAKVISGKKKQNRWRYVYFRHYFHERYDGAWVALANVRYKLVLSIHSTKQWLYDLKHDPDELKNISITNKVESNKMKLILCCKMFNNHDPL